MPFPTLLPSTLGIAVVLLIGDLSAGTIQITQRESHGNFALFAGSGGAVQQESDASSTTALSGPFSFSDSGAVLVSAGDPFSNGGAAADGSISVTDNVSQISPGAIELTATRSAEGSATWASGTGLAQSTEGQEFRVRFHVAGDDAQYSLTGSFDPGISTGTIGDVASVRLYRPFTANVLISIATFDSNINETGTLLAGLTYELRVRLTDKLGASAGNPTTVDASSLNLLFRVNSVPEPASSMLLAFALLSGIGRYRRV